MNNVIRNYSKIADKYEKTLGPISNFLLPEIQTFYRTIPQGSTVLDAGCGPGIEAEIALSFGHKVIGLDLCPEMLKRFQSKNRNSETILADISSIPLKDNSIDAVFSSCVLLHKNKQEGIKAITEFVRILRPQGSLFLITTIQDGREEIYTHQALQDIGVHDLYFYHWAKKDLLDEINLSTLQIKQLSQVQIKEGRPDVIIIQATKRDKQ